MHRAFDERFAADVPYVIAAIELHEECRVFARVDTPYDTVAAGLAVTARYVDHDGWTELRFEPAEPSP